MSISFRPSFRYSGMFKSENVALEFSARTAEIRWQYNMIPDVVGNWLFDTIALCHIFSRTLSKTAAIRFDVQIWHLVRIEARWIFSAVKADYQLTEELDYSGDLA